MWGGLAVADLARVLEPFEPEVLATAAQPAQAIRLRVAHGGAIDGARPGDVVVAVHATADGVAAWCSAGAVAVVVTGEAPEAAVETARDSGIALVRVARSVPTDTLVATLAEAIGSAQREQLARIVEIHERFTHVVLAGGGPAGVAATLADLVGAPVAFLDDGGAVVEVVGAARFDSEAPQVAEVVRAGDVVYGHLVVVAPPESLDAEGRLALERAAMAVAMRQAQAAAVAEADARFAAVTLEELVSGHAGGREEIIDRAASLGWDLTRPRAVLLASIDPPEHGAIPPSALGVIAASARATLGPDAIVWTRSSTVAALIAPDTDDASERRRIALRLQQELDVRLHSATVSIGVGRRVTDPLDLPASFAEASRAVDVGRWAKGRHVTELFDELGLERLLASCPPDELAAFVTHAVGRLAEHDPNGEAGLVETLAVWFDTRNVAEAARRLHVHYNTAKNRLERVEVILGPVLTDPVRALEAEVALYVARHHGIGL